MWFGDKMLTVYKRPKVSQWDQLTIENRQLKMNKPPMASPETFWECRQHDFLAGGGGTSH
jgi:hypothetical protein